MVPTFSLENFHPGPSQGGTLTQCPTAPAHSEGSTAEVPGLSETTNIPSLEWAQLTESVHILRAGGEAFIIAAGAEFGGGFIGRGHRPHLPLGSALCLLLLLGQLPLGHVQGKKSQSDGASCIEKTRWLSFPTRYP